MANYRCTAACRHCLYGCSPAREDGYLSRDKAREICALLRRGGCGSVHIGGGEPFLNFQGLILLVRELREAGIKLEYIETNAFWALGKDSRERIDTLLREGVEALCISLDPYHAEYVPYRAPLVLARRCDQAGLGYFLWKGEFLPDLSRLDPGRPHSRGEMEKAISPGYIHRTAETYGISLGGRAVNIEEEYTPRSPVGELLDHSPCQGLLSTGHFHVDREGFFIPPGCTGIRLPLGEVIEGVEPGKYPAFEALYRGGIGALWELAGSRGFEAQAEGYPSKCNLCFHIRRYLSPRGFAELDGEHYRESLKYYGP
jgi:hypothetical protein